MNNQSKINFLCEAEQIKNLLLQLFKRGQPSHCLSLLVFPNHQIDAFEGIQHRLGGWSRCRARGLARIQALDLTLALNFGFGQFASHHVLHQAQQPQANDQQMDQSGDMQIDLQKQRQQPKHAAFEPTKSLFDDVLPTVNRDRSFQWQLVSVVIGRIEAPAQLLSSFEKRLLVEFDFYFVQMFALDSPRTTFPRSDLALFDRRLDVPVDDSFNSPMFDDLCTSLGCLLRIKTSFPLLVFIQLRQLALRTLDCLIEIFRITLCAFEGTQDQDSLRPSGAIASCETRRPRNCDLETDADRFIRFRIDDDPRIVLLGKQLFDQDLTFRFRELFQSQRTQVIIASTANKGAGFKPSHLFITDIQQAAFAGRFSDTSDLRFIELIVGRIDLDDGRRSWQSQRIQTRHTDLDLRQIGAMIFAVAKLEQPALAYSGVGLTGSRIQAHDFRIQVVNAQQPTTQLSLERLPHGTIPHLRQEVSQS